MSKSVAESTGKYKEHLPQWTRCRDAIKGQDRIHEKGEEYLPMLSGQDTGQYGKYKQQALFYNASGRTFRGYKGLLFRKDPDINALGLDDLVEDCTLSGVPLAEYAEQVTCEELKTSRFGVLVEHPDTGRSNLSQSEAQRQGFRPYFVSYYAEDILEAKTKRVGNKTILYRVRLQETFEQQADDEFKTDPIEQIRVLDLDPDANYAYRQRVFRMDKQKDGDWAEVLDMRKYPKRNGAPISEIPFFMVGGYEYRTPHLVDLVNVNLSHYVAYADHRRGVSFTTRPQPYGTGIKNDDLPGEMVLGEGSFWNFPNSDATLGMLEYTGSGLSASEKQLSELKEDMANLGARMLLPQGSNAETATEFVIKKQGENSSLSDVSNMVSDCLTKAMRFAARWMGVNDDGVEIRLNTDFIPFQATPEELTKMIGAVQTGLYTMDDYLWWARQNEMVDPTIDDQDRKTQLQTAPPPGLQ